MNKKPKKPSLEKRVENAIAEMTSTKSPFSGVKASNGWVVGMLDAISILRRHLGGK